jgi:hypothetical protein
MRATDLPFCSLVLMAIQGFLLNFLSIFHAFTIASNIFRFSQSMSNTIFITYNYNGKTEALPFVAW